MSSLYINNFANINVLGILIRDTSILDNVEKYRINRGDFSKDLHETIFIGINNLYVNGMSKIEPVDIANYLKETYPEKFRIFEDNNGLKVLEDAMKIADVQKLDYYYDLMKKMTLLRTFDEYDIPVKSLYNPAETSLQIKTQQQQWLEETTIEEISNIMKKKVDSVIGSCYTIGDEKAELAGADIFETLKELEESPALGLPLPFGIYNTVVRGARKKKFYISSGASGKGKTRNMIGSAVYLSVSQMYNNITNEWISLTSKVPVLFIATEQEKQEIQTMVLSFISGVNEEKILLPFLRTDEDNLRIKQAAHIFQKSPFYLKCIEDFSISEIENTIKFNVKEYSIYGVFFDYVHTSLKMMEEISERTRGMSLREDQVLFMLSNKLKNIANVYDVFMQTGTQLNGSGNENDGANASSNMLRGSKAIADKADFGEILMGLSKTDKEMLPELKELFNKDGLMLEPNLIRGVYKNRGGKYKAIKIWCYADLGTCKIIPLFITDEDYTPMNVVEYDIHVR